MIPPDPHMLACIYASTYENLIQSCVNLLGDDSLRISLENTAETMFSRFLQAGFMREVVN